jgi:hypothetical protein
MTGRRGTTRGRWGEAPVIPVGRRADLIDERERRATTAPAAIANDATVHSEIVQRGMGRAVSECPSVCRKAARVGEMRRCARCRTPVRDAKPQRRAAPTSSGRLRLSAAEERTTKRPRELSPSSVWYDGELFQIASDPIHGPADDHLKSCATGVQRRPIQTWPAILRPLSSVSWRRRSRRSWFSQVWDPLDVLTRA